MRKLRYLVQIDKDADSDWGASVPDLPGCVATGKTIDAALRRIQGAIEAHLRGMKEDGLGPPAPDDVQLCPGPAGGPSTSMPASLSLPEESSNLARPGPHIFLVTRSRKRETIKDMGSQEQLDVLLSEMRALIFG